ncbi:uncharacterized protein LOC128635196 isoform X2 [Ictalurus punctatus]|uniref:Uncharacterized protein LOC128635196 isoform X2 n=1 Tax=Ictalurus punctatus TaxID=7998 RepID=A0A9F7RCX2_ICTPU|nr:uncharacterized protein LOC128635196 isoform X2 [Ictalurus punctatus]XP_053542825.1 uncharacterized protein LOC128635196 isoform X2 [Ictalurus punctatus]XP_053542826.1 uncharacterized protein LOC128635196 isoform X2 [Ictalurus punctatus]XP_053542827.1 uncharacterized protein LOC128635196 isoform X2 [Ictalurus punctatus]
MVRLELEDVEKQIRGLLDKQAQLLERQTALETSCASAHISKVSTQRGISTPSPSTPCVSLCRDRAPRTFSAVVSVTPAPTHLGPWVNQRRKALAGPSPPPVFEIPTRNRFAPLRQTRPNAVIVGDSIVRNVRVASSKGKVRTHCFSGACVLDVAAQVSGILKKDERIGAVVLHAGTNDTRLQQTEVLKRDFSSLIETVRGRSSSLDLFPHTDVEQKSRFVLMACTPAALERNCCQTTSPRRYTPTPHKFMEILEIQILSSSGWSSNLL